MTPFVEFCLSSSFHPVAVCVCGLLVLALACDALFACWLGRRNRAWERMAARDANGVLVNAAPYTLQGSTKTALLFVHGFADTPETWQLLLPRLHELTGATCRAMRLPWFSTPLRLQKRARLDHWLDAVRDEVARLRTRHEKVFVVGHSLGAGLALLAACENPALADGVVALAPLIRTRRKPAVLFWLADHLCVSTRAVKNPFPEVITTRDGRVYGYPRDRVVAFAVFRALFELPRRLAVAGAGPCHKTPTLAFLSPHDRLIDLPAAERFLDGAEIISSAEAGHVLTLDTGWEQRATEIARFVTSTRLF